VVRKSLPKTHSELAVIFFSSVYVYTQTKQQVTKQRILTSVEQVQLGGASGGAALHAVHHLALRGDAEVRAVLLHNAVVPGRRVRSIARRAAARLVVVVHRDLVAVSVLHEELTEELAPLGHESITELHAVLSGEGHRSRRAFLLVLHDGLLVDLGDLALESGLHRQDSGLHVGVNDIPSAVSPYKINKNALQRKY